MLLAVSVAGAADKVYEKPSTFLKRHFGAIPKTHVLKLSGAQQGMVKKILGHHYPQGQVRYWKDGKKTVWILEEIGKTEPITTGFVVRDGKLSEMRVLIYRESHGWEVERPFFTKQFVGAKLKGARLSKGIDGVVGATLSVRALEKLAGVALYFDQVVK